MHDDMFNLITIAKALSDENRIRIVMALRGRELCVCQVTGLLDLSPSTTSKHLSILRQARLIDSNKKGKWVYYTVPEKAHPILMQAVAFVVNAVKDSARIQEDERHIREVIELGAQFCSAGEDDSFHSLAIHSMEGIPSVSFDE